MRNAVPKEGPRAPLFFAAITLLLSTNLANAQTVDVATLEVCAALETEALKLACFEAIVSKGRTAVAGASPPAAVSSAPDVVPDVTNVSDVPVAIEATSQVTGSMTDPPISDVPTAGTASVAEIPPVAIEVSPRATDTSVATDGAPTTNEIPVADDLGREQLAAPRDDEEQKEVFTATVVDVTQGYNRDLRFHLANGQVWRQIEPRHLPYPKNRDFEIEISQGILGAYRMRIGEKGRQIKIRRTQ